MPERPPQRGSEIGVDVVPRVDSAVGIVAAQFDVAALLAAQTGKDQAGATATYASNEDLWRDAGTGTLRIGNLVRLEGFWLSEWFPLRPGLFHTEDARWARERARDYTLTEQLAMLPDLIGTERTARLADALGDDASLVFDPYGKRAMLNGGIGSVRLAQKQTPDGITWFMGASSTPVAHEGLAVALSQGLYDGLIDEIASRGAIRTTISGRVRPLPPAFDEIREVGVPRFYIWADDVQRARPRRHASFLATGVVLVDSGAVDPERSPYPTWYHESTGIHGAYAAFAPAEPESIKRATTWLAETYATHVLDGVVITDFDEQIPRFGDATFSLARTVGGSVELRSLRNILERCGSSAALRHVFIDHVEHMTMRGGTVDQSRTITIASGAQINAPVTIADAINGSLNKIAGSQMDAGLAELLEQLTSDVAQLTEHIPREVGEQLARDVATLTSEATSPAPRKTWCAMALDGIRTTAIELGAAATPVLALADRVSRLF